MFKATQNDWTLINGVHFARALRASRRQTREEGNRDEGGDGGKIELPFFARRSVRPSVRPSFLRSLSLSPATLRNAN